MRALGGLLLLAVVFASPDVEACSCAAPGPPCSAMFSATVFVGKVKAVKPGANGNAVTTFELTETLHSKTPLGPAVDVHHSTIGSICGVTFDVGRSYVVYASGTAPDQLGVRACGRTHLLGAKDEDVAYAHALPKRTLAVVEGRLFRVDGHDKLPLGNIEVRVPDAGVSVTTTPAGTFSFSVPPGTHALEFVSNVAVPWERSKPVVTLPHPAACATISVGMQWNGRLSGRLTTPDGKPVAGAEVHALAKNPADRRWQISDRTAEDGTFTIAGAAPGSYVLAVSSSDFGGTNPESPWPETYAPGVSTIDKAKVVTLTAAGKAGPIEFVVPKPLPTVTLRVAVKQGGKRVKGLPVSIAPVGGNRSTSGSTDDDGVMTVKELAGTMLLVRACGLSGKNCVQEQRSFTADTTLELSVAE